MNHSFNAASDVPDVVVCGRCGQPIWDQPAGGTCASCESRDRTNACSLFLLNDFTAADISDDAADAQPNR